MQKTVYQILLKVYKLHSKKRTPFPVLGFNKLFIMKQRIIDKLHAGLFFLKLRTFPHKCTVLPSRGTLR